MLTKDLAMYQDAISTFGIAALSDRFEMLRQLGNLFIVQASVLNSYMREGHLAKIDSRLLRPYLLRRADYAKEVRDLEDDQPTDKNGLVGGGKRPDLFGHLPALINGDLRSTSQNAHAAAANHEAAKVDRLAEILAQMEAFTT